MKSFNKKIILFFVLLIGLSFFVLGADLQLNLEIKGIGIRHGTPTNLNLGTIQYSNQEQEITGKFIDYFWLEDRMGLSTGHYTTIQCNGLYGPTGSTITGIYMKAGNINPLRILGNTGNVLIYNNLTGYQSIYNPLVYIYKATDNVNAGKANKYGDNPYIKIIIPPYTSPGTYNGTIVFSLYSY
ncbi:hypothetical protein K9M48_01735 [Candidatus Gracilibacteria bacterium]|nr:hypothetical protein [Candidatus Gracilibacteria bacterium]